MLLSLVSGPSTDGCARVVGYPLFAEDADTKQLDKATVGMMGRTQCGAARPRVA